MPTEDKLKYNHGEKSLKAPFAIYADLECLLIKQQSCQNNLNESYTERNAMHEPCGYSLDLVHLIQNKTVFMEEIVVLKFCSDLKELGTKIINYEEKDMIPLTDSFAMIKMKKINLSYTKKLEITVIIQENLEEVLIAFVI